MPGTSNYTNILAQIKTYLAAVTSIGNVYDYSRNLKTIETFLSSFKSGDYIKGWWIGRSKSIEPIIDDIGNNSRTHTFIIRGIMSYDDASASEKTFQSLVESICDAFRGKYNLNSTCFSASPINVDVVEVRMFGMGGGEMLCHFAELRIEAQELLTNY